jgi:putative GTP pyrophosphokinase
MISLSPEEARVIDDLVRLYVAERHHFENLAGQLRLIADDPGLSNYIHSVKWRVKDPDHLRDKLARRLVDLRSRGESFDVTSDNLFLKITDLTGLRILHLYTRQIEQINKLVLEFLSENMYNVIEGPFARIWDTEYRDYYTSLGIEAREGKTMYTSVHYIVRANMRTARTGEIQVRTLAEEIWGEVDHTINYPHESPKLACREQIKVLARVTSSCSRLVDSIFLTSDEPENGGANSTVRAQPASAAAASTGGL